MHERKNILAPQPRKELHQQSTLKNRSKLILKLTKSLLQSKRETERLNTTLLIKKPLLQL